MQEGKTFVGYEYKEITVPEKQVSMHLDCYENFGWIAEESVHLMAKYGSNRGRSYAKIRMKRNRKIINKMELTRLQRKYEACIHEIEVLEKAKTKTPTIWSLAIGLLGTVFMAGSTFAVVSEPPIIWLCIVLAIPGFAGWILPYFIYRRLLQKQTEKITPLIEEKYDEIYEICEKGNKLTH